MSTPVEPPKTDGQADGQADGQTDGASEGNRGAGLEEPEYDVEVTLANQQADPNNPLFSVKTFKELNLDESVQKGLLNMNFYKPSKIQERALPLLMGNPPQNLIGQSQSGTGKTAAFTLNILSRIDLSTTQPQALILAPSRELARQIVGVVQSMGQFMEKLMVTAAIPDPSKRGQKYEGQVIVGTPGTVFDIIRRRFFDVTGLKVLVLDEADNMLDQAGLGDQCKRVKQYVELENWTEKHTKSYKNTTSNDTSRTFLSHIP
jgi:ATP-dependent RNA helicase DDX19/DBP5